jgi:hypothetical protein
VGAELFHADGQTERHDEANSRFSQFCERTYIVCVHNMNAYGDVEVWLHSLLNFGPRWSLMVHIPTALSQEVCHIYPLNRGVGDVRTGLDIMQKKDTLLYRESKP